MQLRLQPMERALLHEYYRGFTSDPALFMDMSRFHEYVYSPQQVDAYYDGLRAQPDREDFLILLDGAPIGEIALKHIDEAAGRCELSIHLQNDAAKNRGFGMQAERMMLSYAFRERGMKTVLADSVLKNRRSQHILEKLGFQQVGQDDTFLYYQLTADDWKQTLL